MSRQDYSDLFLSADQQDLLMAALKSNQPIQSTRKSPATPQKRQMSNGETPSSALLDSTSQVAPGSGQLDFSDESPYLDFDVDGDDAFNFDINGQMIGDLPDDHTGDLHDKRKSIGDDDDDDEGGGKRREGEDRSGKKPGRKPLTSEPTSKRKAQNRAAQRAFRERKEKHLKDLETKVEELERSSDSKDHELGSLKAQLERKDIELKEYRKRWSWISANRGGRQASSGGHDSQTRTSSTVNNDFQFEFPKFGDLPANNLFSSQSASKQQSSASARSSTLPNPGTSSIASALGRTSRSTSSPRGQMAGYGPNGGSPIATTYSASPVLQSQPQQSPGHLNSIDSLSGLFSPSILEASRNTYFPQFNQNGVAQNSRSSADLNAVPGLYHSASGSNTDSPASSSDSHQHHSSIGTSPEPSLNSPSTNLTDYSLNTINENAQMPSTFGNATAPGFDLNGIQWFAQENGGSFDPELFGDYRESQDAVISQDFGTYFNEAFPLPDLGSPEHNFKALEDSAAPRTDLMKQVQAAQEGDGEIVPGEDRAKLMTCNKIWDRLQSMEKFRNGEIDVDNLCSELRSKARCSEGGAVVHEKDVDRILGQTD